MVPSSTFDTAVHSGLAIVPQKNLVGNLGLGTNGKRHYRRMEADEVEMPLHHPPFVIRDVESDRRFFRTFMKDSIAAKLKPEPCQC